MKLVATLVFALGLAACATPPEPATPAGPSAEAEAALPDSSVDTCGARLFSELVGKQIDGPGVPGASRLVRHILPNTQVTMDYIGQRMNIEADAQGVIRKINCG
jgi:hypothetical protein